MSKHDSYEAWHPGEQERLPEKIARVNGARRMKSLRYEIAQKIWGITDMDITDAEETADAILAKVREALLSDEAVEAAEVRYDDTWDDRTEYGDIRESITAALDAVTGEGK